MSIFEKMKRLVEGDADWEAIKIAMRRMQDVWSGGPAQLGNRRLLYLSLAEAFGYAARALEALEDQDLGKRARELAAALKKAAGKAES